MFTSCIFLLYQLMPEHVGEDGLIFIKSIDSHLISSGNIHHKHARNVSPAMWTSLSPCKLTHKINQHLEVSIFISSSYWLFICWPISPLINHFGKFYESLLLLVHVWNKQQMYCHESPTEFEISDMTGHWSLFISVTYTVICRIMI